jgi:hypothetical protein
MISAAPTPKIAGAESGCGWAPKSSPPFRPNQPVISIRLHHVTARLLPVARAQRTPQCVWTQHSRPTALGDVIKRDPTLSSSEEGSTSRGALGLATSPRELVGLTATRVLCMQACGVSYSIGKEGCMRFNERCWPVINALYLSCVSHRLPPAPPPATPPLYARTHAPLPPTAQSPALPLTFSTPHTTSTPPHIHRRASEGPLISPPASRAPPSPTQPPRPGGSGGR